MSGRLQSWMELARSPSRLWAELGDSGSERALRVATLLALCWGVFLRLYLYVIRPSTLWEDEAYWAWKTLALPILSQTFRPPGFLLLTKGLVTSLGPSALTFRALPFLAGLAGVLLMPYVAGRLFRSNVTRLVAVALMAVHPAALSMSVEFKQYGVEVGVFVVLLAAFLRYRERPSTKTLLTLLGLAWAGFFFSIIIIFVYPPLFGVLLWDAAKNRQFRKLAVAGGGALLCVATISTIYLTTWRKLDEGKAERKWGNKYGVFYVQSAEQSRVSWTLGKYADLAALPGIGRERWETDKLSEPELQRVLSIDRGGWLVFHALGVAWLLWQRRLREAAWLWSPMLVMIAFNVLGRWPAGAFRTNAGMVPFTILLASFGLEALTTLKHAVGRAVVTLAAVFMLAPAFAMRADWFRKETFAGSGQFDEVLEALNERAHPKGKRDLLMDNSSCRPWKFYTGYDVRMSQGIGGRVGKLFRPRCVGGDIRKLITSTAREGGDFWVVLTNRRKFALADAATRKVCGRVDRTEVHSGLHVLWHCLPKNESQ